MRLKRNTFRHPHNKAPGWKPLCHVRSFVDGHVVFRWYGRSKQWWHYEVMHLEELALYDIILKEPEAAS
jgi:hypothetical protein